MKVYNVQIVTNAVMNTQINSAAYNVAQMYGFAIQAVFTGTPTGTFKLQSSSDPATSYEDLNNIPVNWSDIISSPYSVTASGSYMWNVFDAMFTWVRLVYTDTSGGTSAAVLNVRINAKGP
jgi:hypothetical protein